MRTRDASPRAGCNFFPLFTPGSKVGEKRCTDQDTTATRIPAIRTSRCGRSTLYTLAECRRRTATAVGCRTDERPNTHSNLHFPSAPSASIPPRAESYKFLRSSPDRSAVRNDFRPSARFGPSHGREGFYEVQVPPKSVKRHDGVALDVPNNLFPHTTFLATPQRRIARNMTGTSFTCAPCRLVVLR